MAESDSTSKQMLRKSNTRSKTRMKAKAYENALSNCDLPTTRSSCMKPPKIEINKKDLKRMIAGFKESGLTNKRASLAVKKWKRREIRRLQRIALRKSDKICYKCRQSGHTVADCTNDNVARVENFDSGLCFKCGSVDHTSSKCESQIEGFPFAICFVCHQSGHLSRNCKQNDKGLYPMGGSCRECGKVDHLVKNCPKLNELLKDCDKQIKLVARESKFESGIDFEVMETTAPITEVRSDRQRKVVKF